MKRVVAFLPMKGNSERVPNKNLKDFSGKPLYHSIMNTLLKSKYIDLVIVNTDSNEITNDINKNFNKKVKIIKRPLELIGDLVSMNKIVDFDINHIDSSFYIQTHSTNPLLKTETIDTAIEKMKEFLISGSNDSIFSVTNIQTRLYKQNGEALNHNPLELIRTQDLEPLFEENSNFYIFTKESFKNAGGTRIGLKPCLFEIDKIEAIDIDDPQDFLIAEAICSLDL
jgi:CMP-N-acetylneuraminic acid synthetase